MIPHTWADGPMTRQFRSQRQQMGMDPRVRADELAPMTAAAYVRQEMLPRLAREGVVLSDLRNEQEAPEEQVSAQEVKRRGSVDGTLPDGRKARVECRMRVTGQQVGADTYYSWVVVPSITRTMDDLEAAYAHTRVAQDSIVTNPEWQRLEQETQARGSQANAEASRQQHEATMGTIQANTEAMTAAHEARMQDIQRQGDAGTARFNDRMAGMDADHAAWQQRTASQDQQHAYTIDTIRGESVYVDPTTGERVKVEDVGYDHVYRANTGTGIDNSAILATQGPLDPHQVDWQELSRVSQQDY